MSKTAKKFQILIKDERDETCNEMYRDTILQLEVYGPRLEHALHNAEVFLHMRWFAFMMGSALSSGLVHTA